jgi:SAM-dependent methyltransferase
LCQHSRHEGKIATQGFENIGRDHVKRVNLPVYVPDWAYSRIRTSWRALQGNRNLYGDREVEWSFIVSRLPEGPGEALDFGASFGNLSIAAARRGLHVLAIDLEPERFAWKHAKVDFLCADLLKADLRACSFDVIMNCSAVEHVGLRGRYGVAVEESDGDLEAMRKFRELLKPSGKMLMTIPCGKDAAIAPWHRVYGKKRLPKLLEGFTVQEEEYWTKPSANRWQMSSKESALTYEPTGHPTDPTLCSYSIGCFVLTRRDS